MRTRAEVGNEGAKVSLIIMWLLYWCIKTETSKIDVTKVFHGNVKAQILPKFPVFPMGTSGSPITIGQC